MLHMEDKVSNKLSAYGDIRCWCCMPRLQFVFTSSVCGRRSLGVELDCKHSCLILCVGWVPATCIHLCVCQLSVTFSRCGRHNVTQSG